MFKNLKKEMVIGVLALMVLSGCGTLQNNYPSTEIITGGMTDTQNNQMVDSLSLGSYTSKFDLRGLVMNKIGKNEYSIGKDDRRFRINFSQADKTEFDNQIQILKEGGMTDQEIYFVKTEKISSILADGAPTFGVLVRFVDGSTYFLNRTTEYKNGNLYNYDMNKELHEEEFKEIVNDMLESFI